MFIYTLEKNQLINTAHITRVILEAPIYEQKDWCVYACTTMGSHLLYRGTETGCRDFMEDFRVIIYENM